MYQSKSALSLLGIFGLTLTLTWVLVCISYYDIVIHYVWKHISMYLVRYCYHQPILNQSLCKNHPTILWVNHSFKVCISVVHIISFLFAVYCCVYSSSFDIKGIICTVWYYFCLNHMPHHHPMWYTKGWLLYVCLLFCRCVML